MNLAIGHLYPDLLNLYGDRGNVECLRMRSLWRNIECNIIPISLETNLTDEMMESIDILFMGGGEDLSQKQLYDDFITKKGQQIINHIKSGGVGLFVCGGYQLLGKYYRPYKGKDIKGLDIFDLHTRHFGLDKKRLVGNVTIDIEGIEFLKGKKLVGFENHGGRTYLEQNINMLGKIKTGSGNNNEDSTEGAVMHNCIGTYLHGPLLSKNPHLADYLIMTALERRYKKEVDLEPLDDDLEWETHKNAIKLHQ